RTAGGGCRRRDRLPRPHRPRPGRRPGLRGGAAARRRPRRLHPVDRQRAARPGRPRIHPRLQLRPDPHLSPPASPRGSSLMLRTMMKSKIHRATVTQADLHYVGSVTVDADLLDAANLLPGELVHIVDITNGARLETYTIAGERGSGIIGINGAAARLVQPGDLVIVIAYAHVEDAAARSYQPDVVFVDADNKVIGYGHDPAEALPQQGLLRGDLVHTQG